MIHEQSDGHDTSVHTQETSVPPTSLPDSYRTFRTRSCVDELRATEQTYSALDIEDGTDRLSHLRECRTKAWFLRELQTGKVSVASNSCKLRWCPLCAKSRAAYISRSVRAWLTIQVKPKLLTLTLKHTSAPLEHQCNYLYQAFRQFRGHKTISREIRGGIWFFQVKKSEISDEWHPHLHCLIDSEYIPQQLLSGIWCKITGGSSIVDIRAVKNPKKAADYVARYAARPTQLSKLSHSDRLEVFKAMHGRRLCGSWGNARIVSLKPPVKIDANAYEHIGTWAVVVGLEGEDPRAAQILEAWRNGTPLTPNISLRDIDQFIDDSCYDLHQIDHSDPQSTFW